MHSLRDTLAEAIAQIVQEKGRSPKPIDDADTLRESLGLDSLDLAVLVVRLEQQLGVDPFRDGRGLVPTFGELVARYDHAQGNTA